MKAAMMASVLALPTAASERDCLVIHTEATAGCDDQSDRVALDNSFGSDNGIAYDTIISMSHPLLKLIETSDTGRGWYASRALDVGTELFLEEPLHARTASDLTDLVAQNLDAYSYLCHSVASVTPYEVAGGIVRSNHFRFADHVFLFREISMLNHSCNPNASIVYTDSGRAKVRLARNVEKDEQITLAYCGDVLFKSREVRQATLQKLWGFTCGCERCQEVDNATTARWMQLEEAAAVADANIPRLPVLDSSIAQMQKDAAGLIEEWLPLLEEGKRFRDHAVYFA